jgi:hypothetical protein
MQQSHCLGLHKSKDPLHPWSRSTTSLAGIWKSSSGRWRVNFASSASTGRQTWRVLQITIFCSLEYLLVKAEFERLATQFTLYVVPATKLLSSYKRAQQLASPKRDWVWLLNSAKEAITGPINNKRSGPKSIEICSRRIESCPRWLTNLKTSPSECISDYGPSQHVSMICEGSSSQHCSIISEYDS